MERLEAFDLGMLYWFGSWHHPWLDRVMVAATRLGNPLVLCLVLVVGALLLLRLRRRRLAAVLVLVGLLSWALDWGTKFAVARPRPDVAWRLTELPEVPSFPSGHALCSMAIYGSLGLLCSHLARRRWQRDGLVLGGVALSLLIGLSRPYLGVHYPLDVLTGWVGGLICVAMTAALTGPRQALVPVVDDPPGGEEFSRDAKRSAEAAPRG